uniref:PH domain-containing protein n=1 Tax=Rhabditophanes sp. KR3021 TaxID=114890 RepID=A0AC35U0D5_9BILA
MVIKIEPTYIKLRNPFKETKFQHHICAVGTSQELLIYVDKGSGLLLDLQELKGTSYLRNKHLDFNGKILDYIFVLSFSTGKIQIAMEKKDFDEWKRVVLQLYTDEKLTSLVQNEYHEKSQMDIEAFSEIELERTSSCSAKKTNTSQTPFNLRGHYPSFKRHSDYDGDMVAEVTRSANSGKDAANKCRLPLAGFSPSYIESKIEVFERESVEAIEKVEDVNSSRTTVSLKTALSVDEIFAANDDDLTQSFACLIVKQERKKSMLTHTTSFDHLTSSSKKYRSSDTKYPKKRFHKHQQLPDHPVIPKGIVAKRRSIFGHTKMSSITGVVETSF